MRYGPKCQGPRVLRAPALVRPQQHLRHRARRAVRGEHHVHPADVGAAPASTGPPEGRVPDGVRWSFISLIPWAGLSFLLVLRLSLIGELPGSKLVAKTQETGKRADEEPNKESVGTEDEKARGLKGSESSKGELDLESAN